MFFKRKKQKKNSEKGDKQDNVIEVTLEQMRQAVNEYARHLPKGISLRSIIEDDHCLNYQLLKLTLGGIPSRPFYMSKETFEIFETAELPKQIDCVQKAVDQYMQEYGEKPIIPGDPCWRISYYLIRHYLTIDPNVELYLDKADNMVTHRRPK